MRRANEKIAGVIRQREETRLSIGYDPGLSAPGKDRTKEGKLVGGALLRGPRRGSVGYEHPLTDPQFMHL